MAKRKASTGQNQSPHRVIDGNNAVVHVFRDKDGTETPIVAVQTTQRKPGTRFTQIELDAVQGYLDRRISGNDDAWWTLEGSNLKEIAWLIEGSELRFHPIDSAEFRASRLALIPADVIHALAITAGISLVDARKLPLQDLIRVAAIAKKPPQLVAQKTADDTPVLPFGLQRCDVPQTLKRSGLDKVCTIQNEEYWKLMESLIAAYPYAVSQEKLNHLFGNDANGRKNACTRLKERIHSLNLTVKDWVLEEWKP